MDRCAATTDTDAITKRESGDTGEGATGPESTVSEPARRGPLPAGTGQRGTRVVTTY